MMWNPSFGQDLGAHTCGESAVFEQHINALTGGCEFPEDWLNFIVTVAGDIHRQDLSALN